MTHTFSIKEAIRFGWHKTRDNSGVLFQALLVLFALQVVSAIVQRVLEHTVLGFIATIALTVVGVFVGTGLTVMSLKIARNEHTELRDIWPNGRLVWHYFLASCLAGIIILGGCILLIIPGIYFALRYAFVKYAVIDGASVTDSLGKSAVLTKDIKWKLLGFAIVLGLLNLLGFVVLVVGLLVSIPVSIIAVAHVYNTLKHHHHGHAA